MSSPSSPAELNKELDKELEILNLKSNVVKKILNMYPDTLPRIYKESEMFFMSMKVISTEQYLSNYKKILKKFVIPIYINDTHNITSLLINEKHNLLQIINDFLKLNNSYYQKGMDPWLDTTSLQTICCKIYNAPVVTNNENPELFVMYNFLNNFLNSGL